MLCLYPGEELESIKLAIAETKNSGAEIVSLYKGGSAYFAPAAGVMLMLENILGNKKSVLPAVAVLEGEYGYRDIAFGVPLKLSQGGIEEIVELELSQPEREELNFSLQPIRDSIAYIEQKGFL
jgi:malate dehydrogenase